MEFCGMKREIDRKCLNHARVHANAQSFDRSERGPMICDNFSIFRTNCAILTSCIRADPRTCRGFSRGCCHVALSTSESCEILLSIFHSDGKE